MKEFGAIIKLEGMEFHIPEEIINIVKGERNGWICAYYDFDRGILNWKIIENKVDIKEATAFLITGEMGDPLEALIRYKNTVKKKQEKLEQILVSLEMKGLEDFLDEFHTELLMEYDCMSEEIIWLDKIIRALSSNVEEVEGFFKIIRRESYEVLILEEVRAVMMLNLDFLRKLITEPRE